MEDIVYDDINDYVNYLPFFYKYMWMSLTTFGYSAGDVRAYHPYASAVWPIFLTEKYHGAGIMRQIWEGCGAVAGYNVLPVTNDVLNARGSSIQNDFLEFEVWNFHTGRFADTTRFFSEGNLFPVAESTVVITNLQELESYPLAGITHQPEDLAANMLVILPNVNEGGVNVNFDGDDLISSLGWHVALLGFRQTGSIWTSMPVNPISGQGNGSMVNWDFYDAVVVIPAVAGVGASDTTINHYSGNLAFNSALITNNDIGVINFNSPAGAGRKGDAIEPSVSYMNVGRINNSFPARLLIEHRGIIYDQTVQVTELAPGETRDIAFPEFIPTDVGTYLFTAISQLNSDEFTQNDTLELSYNSIGGIGRLYSAYPSPFLIESSEDLVTVPISTDPSFKDFKAKMRVFDTSGRLVRELSIEKFLAIGSSFYGFKWDGKNDNDEYVASGIYIYFVDTGDKGQTGKIALINQIK
jgi:hypothetical protein